MRFWLINLAGWLAYSLTLILSYLPTTPPESQVSLVITKALRVPVLMVASGILERLYRPLLRDPIHPGRLALVAVPASIALGAASLFAHSALLVAAGLGGSLWPSSSGAMIRHVSDFAFALVGWTGGYLGVVLFQRQEQQRREVAEARRLAQEAQLEALGYQLNPHFLFNALNSIRAMIDEDQSRARTMVTQLSGFLRYGLVTSPLKTTTVGDEMAAIEGYLAIEQTRFEAKLDVTMRIAAAARDRPIPAFLIHPLVENALKHGQGLTPENPLRVRIEADTEGDVLRIAVANTGRLGPSGERRRGIGLANVTERLARLYPGRHRFALTEGDGWVRAELAIPS